MDQDRLHEDFKIRFPELYTILAACTTRGEIIKISKAIEAGMDAGSLDYAACDGALQSFKKARLAEFRTPKIRTPEQEKIERIMRTTDSTGKHTARKWK